MFRILIKWPYESFIQCEKMFGSRVAKARFRQNRFIRALLAAQATLSSTISPALSAMPRLKVAVVFGVIWVFGGLWDEM